MLNVLMMMTANLVGFVIGIDGVKYFLHQLVGSPEGLRFLAAVFACLFVGVQLMFEYRCVRSVSRVRKGLLIRLQRRGAAPGYSAKMLIGRLGMGAPLTAWIIESTN